MKIMKSTSRLVLGLVCLTLVIIQGQGQQCGKDVGGKECPGKICCSFYGYCGTTPDYCDKGCQSNCHHSPPPAPPPPPTPPSPITDIFPEQLFDQFLMHRGSNGCKGAFYTYSAFITAANDYPEFGNTGDLEIRKREIAAFFGQTSQETYGGWDNAPDGKYAWGYCWIEERGCEPRPSPCEAKYCDHNPEWPCVPGQPYYGRGPIQLSHNYNYGLAGQALMANKYELLNNPDRVHQDPIISFKTALWFWMTPQSPKPSCHDVITGKWKPTDVDKACNRLPGYGVITNIINGGIECNQGPNDAVIHRIGFYERYCGILGISPGDNLDCYHQCPFNQGLFLEGKSSSF